jgi:hypothetical protein
MDADEPVPESGTPRTAPCAEAPTATEWSASSIKNDQAHGRSRLAESPWSAAFVDSPR